MSDVFVFGSNLAGRHGKGAARDAVAMHGAIYGRGVGMQGNSYAIPTKDFNLRSLPLPAIAGYVQNFLAFARMHQNMNFQVTAIGTGLAGYTANHIGPMFRNAPANCKLPPEFEVYR